MDKFVYTSIDSYFHTLENLGYVQPENVKRLLVLIFYYNLVTKDYRGFIEEKDYHEIEEVLNVLYGTNCLMPYPDYLKMDKLKLGEIQEILTRTKNLEEADEILNKKISDHSVLIKDNIRRLDKYEGGSGGGGGEIDPAIIERLDDAESRLNNIESTKVIKGKRQVATIPDIIISDVFE